MIQVDGLTKWYGDHVAVDKLSFRIEQGEVVGFLGPNGAGKTTTMRMLTCYLPASSGKASIAGHDIFSESLAIRRKTGYLPETPPLYPELKVVEYLLFRSRLKGVARRQRKLEVERVMERSGIAARARFTIGHLSKGYRQRVGLADALIGNPPILVLDEPTSAMDPNQIREVRGLIRELGRDHTVILSTHILAEVEAVCRRAVIISGGRLRADDTLENLRRGTGQRSRLRIELQDGSDKVESILRELPGALSVKRQDTIDGWTPFLVETTMDHDLRPGVWQAAKKGDWNLRELHLDNPTLEDVFLQATQNSAAPAAREPEDARGEAAMATGPAKEGN